MCGRTSLFLPQPEIERRFGAEFVEAWEPRYNIAPRQEVPTIRSRTSSRIDQFEWGFRPHWVDDPADWPHPINARAETVAEKPAFRDAFRSNRCLVLADGFYEWQSTRDGTQPYRIELADRAPFAFAGLWAEWEGNGTTHHSITIITTDSNAVVDPIHDRMPVMLQREEEATWLSAEEHGSLQELLDPFPSDRLRAYPISTRVNTPSNDSPDIIDPIEPASQSGLDDFTGNAG